MRATGATLVDCRASSLVQKEASRTKKRVPTATLCYHLEGCWMALLQALGASAQAAGAGTRQDARVAADRLEPVVVNINDHAKQPVMEARKQSHAPTGGKGGGDVRYNEVQ